MSCFTTCTPRVHKEKGNAANVAFENQIDHWSGLSLYFFFCSPLSLTSQASITQAEKLAFGCSRLSLSTLASILSISSCGKRMCFFADFWFLSPVATVEAPLSMVGVVTPYIKKNGKKRIDVGSHQNVKWVHTLMLSWCPNGNAPKCGNTIGASNHNVSRSNIMACSHDTQTRPEFTYLFLGTPSDKPDTTPVVLRAEANTEQQARSHFLNWNLVFAAQIRTKAPCRLQLMDGGDYFSWLYEQRFDTCTPGVQGVVHG